MKATIICGPGATGDDHCGFGATCADCGDMLVIRPKIRRLKHTLKAEIICVPCHKRREELAKRDWCVVELRPDGTDWEDQEVQS